MHFRSSLLILCVCLLAAGCRRDPYRDAYFDILNAEKRVLEDRLFEAEDNYERALRELESCRARQDATPASRPAASTREAPPTPEPDLPEIELPPGFDGGARRSPGPDVYPASLHTSSSARSPIPGPGPASAAGPIDDRPPVDRRIASIYLNPRHTGGLDLDGQPGDDGLSVLIQPRNELGQYVAEPGQVSLVLLDPVRQGEAARLARWDFDREATARMLSTGGADRGLHVCVPWPELPPHADRLQLFVRYIGDAGQAVEADREITLRSTGLLADRWTPRAELPIAQRQRPSAAEASGVIHASHAAPLADQPTEPSPGPQPAGDQRLPKWRPER